MEKAHLEWTIILNGIKIPEINDKAQTNNEVGVEPTSPLGEEFVRSLLGQYKGSLKIIEKGSMRYFQWLNGWTETGNRKELEADYIFSFDSWYPKEDFDLAEVLEE